CRRVSADARLGAPRGWGHRPAPMPPLVRRACWSIASRPPPTPWARRDTAPHRPLHTVAALPISVTTGRLNMVVSLPCTGTSSPVTHERLTLFPHVALSTRIPTFHRITWWSLAPLIASLQTCAFVD